MYASRRLSVSQSGKAAVGVAPMSEPESEKPAFRDRREACGIAVMTGAGLRPIKKPMNEPLVPYDHARATFLIPTPSLPRARTLMRGIAACVTKTSTQTTKVAAPDGMSRSLTT